MFYELIRALLPHVGGLTAEAVKEMEDAIEQHQAEHNALVAGGREPAPSPAEAAPASAVPVTAVQEGIPA